MAKCSYQKLALILLSSVTLSACSSLSTSWLNSDEIEPMKTPEVHTQTAQETQDITPPVTDTQNSIARLEQDFKGLRQDIQDLTTLIRQYHSQSATPPPSAYGNPPAGQKPQPLMKAPLQPAPTYQTSMAPSPAISANNKNVPPGARPMAASTPPVIKGIRVGEHADRVRIVLDTNDKIKSTILDIDNSENILVLEIPGVTWDIPAHGSYGKMAVLESYDVDTANNILVIQLKKNTNILSQSKIGAVTGSGQRIVIDLTK